MKHIITILFALAVGMTASAQSADKLYKEAKALYDAKNYTAAVPKLKAAADKGHKKAQYRLGRCYDKGRGVTEDDAQAFKWYQKSAVQGYAKAQYQLGKSYKNGEGTAKDRRQAFVWFEKAARQGNADAELQLGKAYLKGKGVTADTKKAKSWLTKAIANPKGGDKILSKLRREASEGDENAKAILGIVGK